MKICLKFKFYEVAKLLLKLNNNGVLLEQYARSLQWRILKKLAEKKKQIKIKIKILLQKFALGIATKFPF